MHMKLLGVDSSYNNDLAIVYCTKSFANLQIVLANSYLFTHPADTELR